MTDYLALATEVGAIARRAGAAILEIYESEDFGVELKADDSPLTRADRAANGVIEAGLRALTFQAPIISEEGDNVTYATRSQFTRFWLVDPLDGTKEFIKRNGDFTVNIALVESGKPVLGVVYVPVTDELFYSAPGQGAWQVNGAAGEPVRIAAASFTLQDPNLRIVASRSHLNQETQDIIDRFDRPELVQRGSSLKIIELARGGAHVYPRLAPTMEWDTAAAHAILLEAGGRMVDEETGKDLRYNKPSLLNPYFIAYGKVREELLTC
ncbi:3'(2'),5'-bisphosphate nucleotidase CysQ [Neolewinella lacunae]|uniref:3'(2'),5'-bisphosphate nucleotidase CysQ n=1 Tax=Neolewinella lacunae TaxID=1517758 RepID=A0A923T848_9BACT|nr:3'(2'),5'-bisphosphate nucleotidase CysQ [Neolewinella lacunae]MBC6994196.1 3'(2'),5'-bisphosphate nucleotidase CysQ [Neolewinella lacunae]MDN3634645.1 3'(2'),5'-bisphosphate nucleotidase CysQ [Neolewinella lacunae]